MEYIKLTLAESDAAQREILMARLAEEGFESFEEVPDALIAYIAADAYTDKTKASVATWHAGGGEVERIQQQNWNAQWEEAFEPVTVAGFCTIRAGFHAPDHAVPYEIIITPKMSFGTGHHATTMLMVEQMRNTDFVDKHVLDFGTGTGVLAILAGKLGAASVLAIDNDEWSYENTLENVAANNARGIEVRKGSLEAAESRKFDIILANINRHILLQYMQEMHALLENGGVLIMSGILDADEQIVMSETRKAGFKHISVISESKWLCITAS
jgi:ribosomal protein L11 methyltransferase